MKNREQIYRALIGKLFGSDLILKVSSNQRQAYFDEDSDREFYLDRAVSRN